MGQFSEKGKSTTNPVQVQMKWRILANNETSELHH